MHAAVPGCFINTEKLDDSIVRSVYTVMFVVKDVASRIGSYSLAS